MDKTPPVQELLSNPLFKFVQVFDSIIELKQLQGDGFEFTLDPQQKPVDWLLCDILTSPVKSVVLLKNWIEQRLCRAFCVTVKFQGEIEIEPVQEAKDILRASGAEFQIRKLIYNKNEVCIFGFLK